MAATQLPIRIQQRNGGAIDTVLPASLHSWTQFETLIREAISTSNEYLLANVEYLDNEGDNITVSSDAELVEMISVARSMAPNRIVVIASLNKIEDEYLFPDRDGMLESVHTGGSGAADSSSSVSSSINNNPSLFTVLSQDSNSTAETPLHLRSPPASLAGDDEDAASVSSAIRFPATSDPFDSDGKIDDLRNNGRMCDSVASSAVTAVGITDSRAGANENTCSQTGAASGTLDMDISPAVAANEYEGLATNQRHLEFECSACSRQLADSTRNGGSAVFHRCLLCPAFLLCDGCHALLSRGRLGLDHHPRHILFVQFRSDRIAQIEALFPGVSRMDETPFIDRIVRWSQSSLQDAGSQLVRASATVAPREEAKERVLDANANVTEAVEDTASSSSSFGSGLESSEMVMVTESAYRPAAVSSAKDMEVVLKSPAEVSTNAVSTNTDANSSSAPAPAESASVIIKPSAVDVNELKSLYTDFYAMTTVRNVVRPSLTSYSFNFKNNGHKPWPAGVRLEPTSLASVKIVDSSKLLERALQDQVLADCLEPAVWVFSEPCVAPVPVGAQVTLSLLVYVCTNAKETSQSNWRCALEDRRCFGHRVQLHLKIAEAPATNAIRNVLPTESNDSEAKKTDLATSSSSVLQAMGFSTSACVSVPAPAAAVDLSSVSSISSASSEAKESETGAAPSSLTSPNLPALVSAASQLESPATVRLPAAVRSPEIKSVPVAVGVFDTSYSSLSDSVYADPEVNIVANKRPRVVGDAGSAPQSYSNINSNSMSNSSSNTSRSTMSSAATRREDERLSDVRAGKQAAVQVHSSSLPEFGGHGVPNRPPPSYNDAVTNSMYPQPPSYHTHEPYESTATNTSAEYGTYGSDRTTAPRSAIPDANSESLYHRFFNDPMPLRQNQMNATNTTTTTPSHARYGGDDVRSNYTNSGATRSFYNRPYSSNLPGSFPQTDAAPALIVLTPLERSVIDSLGDMGLSHLAKDRELIRDVVESIHLHERTLENCVQAVIDLLSQTHQL